MKKILQKQNKWNFSDAKKNVNTSKSKQPKSQINFTHVIKKDIAKHKEMLFLSYI